LQAFCPAQAFFAVAQKLCPLQLLMPEHRTWTTLALSWALATTPSAMNKSATAVAIEKDFASIFRLWLPMDLHQSARTRTKNLAPGIG